MPDFPSFQDLERIAQTELLSRNSNLTREIVERRGSDANALVAVAPAVGDEVTGQLIQVNASLFLDTAKGVNLDRLVFDRYQILRKPASPAIGEVAFTTIAPNPSGFSIPAGTQLKSTDGKVFQTTVQTTFPTGSTGPVTVPVQSVLSGLSQQARANTITSIITAIGGAAPDLAVNNPLATAGADDEETDTQLRNRAKLYYTTAFRGTLKAIERGALDLAGVRSATAFEALNENGQPCCIVELVISDAFIEQLVDSFVIPSSYQAQSAQLAVNVAMGLNEVRAAGIQVSVTVGIVRILGVALALRFRAGADVTAATAAAKTAIVNYVNNLRPGEDFIVDDAELALANVPGLIVLGGEIASPAGDVIAQPLEVLRTGFGFVTVGECAEAAA